MSELDLITLNALQADSSLPSTQIVKIAGVAESTIWSHYSGLVERGTVQTIAVIDPFAVGYNAPALIGISVEPAAKPALRKYLRQAQQDCANAQIGHDPPIP